MVGFDAWFRVLAGLIPHVFILIYIYIHIYICLGSALEKCSLLAHAIHGWWCCINQTWDAKWPGVSLQREAVRVAREIIGIEGEKKRRWWNFDDIKLPSIYELGESRITMKDQVYFPVFFFGATWVLACALTQLAPWYTGMIQEIIECLVFAA